MTHRTYPIHRTIDATVKCLSWGGEVRKAVFDVTRRHLEGLPAEILVRPHRPALNKYGRRPWYSTDVLSSNESDTIALPPTFNAYYTKRNEWWAITSWEEYQAPDTITLHVYGLDGGWVGYIEGRLPFAHSLLDYLLHSYSADNPTIAISSSMPAGYTFEWDIARAVVIGAHHRYRVTRLAINAKYLEYPLPR